MTWFKSDDSFWRHPKIRKLGKDRLPAVGLWQLAGTWCADNIAMNTADGFIPDEQVEQWDPKHRYAKRLVAVGLWYRTEVDGEHGYLFHDWAEYQHTRESVEAEREEWRKKKQKQRQQRRSPQASSRMSPRDTTRDRRETDEETPPENPKENPPSGHPSVTTAPSPSPSPSLTGVPGAGGRHQTPDPDQNPPTPENPTEQRPPDRCAQHRDVDDPPPCGHCADARRAAETWDTQHNQRREQLAADIEQARADPRQRCEHGTDGGQYIHPTTGKSATCALCRRDRSEAS